MFLLLINMSSKKSRSLDKQEKLVNEIKKIRKNIRKKHQTLTQNVIDEEQFAEKSLKPIITPLQKLVQEKTNSSLIKKEEQQLDVEMDDIQSRLQNKRFSEETENIPISNKRTVETPLPLPREEEITYETLPTVEELMSTSKGRQSIEPFIDIWFKGPLIRHYMRKFFDDSNHDIDHVFGPYFGDNNILMLGKYPLKTDESDIITINNVMYKGTPGLYDLIFMKTPNAYVYSQEDLDEYSRIISETRHI